MPNYYDAYWNIRRFPADGLLLVAVDVLRLVVHLATGFVIAWSLVARHLTRDL